ncbi:MAG TPA: Rrf2 family transcriptional regulator [Acidobacteriota bacterium]|nr:Rrf2 family transcriptional regulator [Acidobacteriota bacterium]
MIQTESGRYALRAMTFMGSRGDPFAPVSAAEVAKEEGIPPHYLAKVLQDLVKGEVLTSVRGRGGGFMLSRPPDKIFVVEVLRAVEDVDTVLTECILGLEECSDSTPCAMHDLWGGYRETLWNTLCTTTISDLTREGLEALRGTPES